MVGERVSARSRLFLTVIFLIALRDHDMAPKVMNTDMPFPVFSTEADRDYILARLIHFVGGPFGGRAGFFAQMACEKYLKALSVQREKAYLETHKLRELAARCEPYGPYFSDKETIRVLEQFDMFDQIGRYAAAANFDPLSKGQSVSGITLNISTGIRIAGAWVWIPKYLDDLDSFVFSARALLDFDKTKFGDGLKAVLSGNAAASSLGSWQLPIPLHEVLTDAHFKMQTQPTAWRHKSE